MTVTSTHTKVCEKNAAHGEFELVWIEYRNRFGGSCPKCEAEDEARRLNEARREKVCELRGYAKIPARFASKGFEDYSPKTPHQRAALKGCQEYAKNLIANLEAGACLVLLGPPGVGKTHLLCSIVDAATEHFVRPLYATMPDFLKAIRGNWAWHAEEHAGDFTSPRLLALDEVWTPAHERDREALVALIDERYRACDSTILASNLSWTELRAALGERLCDRLRENGGQVLGLDGESFRSQRNG